MWLEIPFSICPIPPSDSKAGSGTSWWAKSPTGRKAWVSLGMGLRKKASLRTLSNGMGQAVTFPYATLSRPRALTQAPPFLEAAKGRPTPDCSPRPASPVLRPKSGAGARG